MNMNRETKRRLARQGGDQPAKRAEPRRAPAGGERKRTTPREYLRGVRSELAKVAWPTGREVVNSTIIVLITIVVLSAIIYLVDTGADRLVRFVYE